ncbi:MAG TPA: hypothetical protein VFG54_12340 [Prolixibacteraceae bacterium]|nr:hypothetical protein [Prolixibacteraceae bacterium]
MSKLTQTDHDQQSLVLFPRTKCLLREGMEAILDNPRLDVVLRDDALQLKRYLEDAGNEDKPAKFWKSQGALTSCSQCQGTGSEKTYPTDREDEPEFITCHICKGEGQLYYEVTRKYYVPTEYHRRKLTK